MHAPGSSSSFRAGGLVLITALALVSFRTSATAARSRDRSAPPPTPEVYAPVDPYMKYLDVLGSESSSCKSHVDEAKKMLNAQADLTSRYAQASPEERKQLDQSLRDLGKKLAAAEVGLEKCYGPGFMTRKDETMWSEAAPPKSSNPPPADQSAAQPAANATTTDSGESGSAQVPTAPQPPLPATPPPPPRELSFVQMLKSRAGETTYAHDFATDVQNLLEQRRVLALRFLEASDEERPYLNAVIAAVSHRLHDTADAIDQALEIASD